MKVRAYGFSTRHIALDCGHLQKREQLLMEETSDRAKDFITRKEKLEKQLTDVEVIPLINVVG